MGKTNGLGGSGTQGKSPGRQGHTDSRSHGGHSDSKEGRPARRRDRSCPEQAVCRVRGAAGDPPVAGRPAGRRGRNQRQVWARSPPPARKELPMRLGGWHRLWIVLSMLWLLMVVPDSFGSFPDAEDAYNQMEPQTRRELDREIRTRRRTQLAREMARRQDRVADERAPEPESSRPANRLQRRGRRVSKYPPAKPGALVVSRSKRHDVTATRSLAPPKGGYSSNRSCSSRRSSRSCCWMYSRTTRSSCPTVET